MTPDQFALLCGLIAGAMLGAAIGANLARRHALRQADAHYLGEIRRRAAEVAEARDTLTDAHRVITQTLRLVDDYLEDHPGAYTIDPSEEL